MSELVRFGVSMDSKLLTAFDELIERKGYANRSEAIRDLLRNELVRVEWENEEQETVATVTLVYSHEVRELADKLLAIQHEHHRLVVSALHVHLDSHNCLEVLVLRGKAGLVRQIAERLVSTKGVRHGKIAMTTTGAHLH